MVVIDRRDLVIPTGEDVGILIWGFIRPRRTTIPSLRLPAGHSGTPWSIQL